MTVSSDWKWTQYYIDKTSIITTLRHNWVISWTLLTSLFLTLLSFLNVFPDKFLVRYLNQSSVISLFMFSRIPLRSPYTIKPAGISAMPTSFCIIACQAWSINNECTVFENPYISCQYKTNHFNAKVRPRLKSELPCSFYSKFILVMDHLYNMSRYNFLRGTTK